MKKRLVFLLLLAGGLACSANAQPDTQTLPHPDEEPIAFDGLYVEDELSQETVYSIIQDRKGFMSRMILGEG